MDTINYAQVVYQSEHQDEISKAVIKFRKLLALSMSNTVFQLAHFDLVREGISLSEFVKNGDINKTVIDKLNSYNESVEEILSSDEFNSDANLMRKLSAIISKRNE